MTDDNRLHAQINEEREGEQSKRMKNNEYQPHSTICDSITYIKGIKSPRKSQAKKKIIKHFCDAHSNLLVALDDEHSCFHKQSRRVTMTVPHFMTLHTLTMSANDK